MGPPRAPPLVSSMALLLRPEPTIVQKVRIIEYGCQQTRPCCDENTAEIKEGEAGDGLPK